MSDSVYSISCGLPFCCDASKEEASFSLRLRISAFAIGALGVAVGTLILCNVPWISQGGMGVVYPTLIIGGALLVAALAVRIVKTPTAKEPEKPVETVEKLDLSKIIYTEPTSNAKADYQRGEAIDLNSASSELLETIQTLSSIQPTVYFFPLQYQHDPKNREIMIDTTAIIEICQKKAVSEKVSEGSHAFHEDNGEGAFPLKSMPGFAFFTGYNVNEAAIGYINVHQIVGKDVTISRNGTFTRIRY